MNLLRGTIAGPVLPLAVGHPPATAERRSAPSVSDFMAVWLQSEFSLVRPGGMPDLVSMPPTELVRCRYGTAGGADTRTGNSIAGISRLAHEMVHHVEAEAGTVFACSAEREKLACGARDAGLQMFGGGLRTTCGIDPALLPVATACIHSPAQAAVLGCLLRSTAREGPSRRSMADPSQPPRSFPEAICAPGTDRPDGVS